MDLETFKKRNISEPLPAGIAYKKDFSQYILVIRHPLCGIYEKAGEHVRRVRCVCVCGARGACVRGVFVCVRCACVLWLRAVVCVRCSHHTKLTQLTVIIPRRLKSKGPL